MPFLSLGAYILISGIKFEKFVRQNFSFVYPPTSRIQKIGSKSKVNFVRTFFKKTKCTHVNVKNLGGQVSGPKNMATAMVYFSKFPCGSPCSLNLISIVGFDFGYIGLGTYVPFQVLTPLFVHTSFFKTYTPKSKQTFYGLGLFRSS